MTGCQKDQFGIPAATHYLNCAYMSPLSKRVQEAGIQGVRRKAMPADIIAEDFFSGPNKTRELFAELIGVSAPDRVAVVPAVSYGIGAVARNLSVARGQTVVTLQDQFPSHVYAWRRLCAKSGAEVNVVTAPVGAAEPGAAWNQALLEAIDKDTAVVAVPPAHWTDGTVFGLEEIGRRAREVGAALVVDGTQAIGACAFDVELVQPDAVICAAYKWLGGPYSIGAAYFGPRFDSGVPLEETWIAREGSEDFSKLVEYQDSYRPGAVRFDVGEVSNFILVPMFNAALEQLADWGVESVGAYCAQLTADLIDDMENAGFGVTEAAFRSPHVFGFRLPAGFDLASLQARLAEKRVFVSLRGESIRVSPHLYNDEEDVLALRQALKL